MIAGSNKFIFPNAVNVVCGSFIYLTQTSSQIAIDTTGNSAFSDLVWTSTFWSKLNEFQNYRLYFKALNNFTSYFNSFELSHSYSTIGTFNIMLSFSGSAQVLTQQVLVTDCKLNLPVTNIILIIIKLFTFDLAKFVSLNSLNSGNTVDKTINSTVLVYSTSLTDVVSIDYGDNQSETFQINSGKQLIRNLV